MTCVLAACGQRPTPVTPAVPQVRIAQVGGTTVPDTITATGKLAWRRETSLGFTSAGRIATVAVNEGDSVRPGQLLAALDSTTVAASVAAARAERHRAAAEYARSAKLFEQGWVTQPRVDNARARSLPPKPMSAAPGFSRAMLPSCLRVQASCWHGFPRPGK